MPERLRILICDDNDAVRLTLTRALRYKPGIEVAGEAACFADLLALAGASPVDVVLVDVNMPGMTGIEGLAELRRLGHTMPVIVMSAERRNEEPALAAGAACFFYKGSTDVSRLVDDIRAAAGGR